MVEPFASSAGMNSAISFNSKEAFLPWKVSVASACVMSSVDLTPFKNRLAAIPDSSSILAPVAWEEQETYAEALAWVSERVFSYHWRLPDEVWRAAAAQVRAEIQAEQPDLDTPRPARHSFQFVLARFPAAGGREQGGSREAGRGTGTAVGDPP